MDKNEIINKIEILANVSRESAEEIYDKMNNADLIKWDYDGANYGSVDWDSIDLIELYLQ